jgi:hypothetical protein
MAGLKTTDGWVARYSGVGGAMWRIYFEGGGPTRSAPHFQVRAAFSDLPGIFPSDVPPFDAAEDVEHEDDDQPAGHSSLPTGQSHA